ncbi:MAG: nickel pincer cofactor biosynthesis protein LarC [Thalassovita sp.]
MKRIHLDPVGGLSGDMFLAAMLDACPELEAGVDQVISAIGFEDQLKVRRVPHDTGVLTGSQVKVEELVNPNAHQTDHTHHHHAHHHFRDIRAILQTSGLSGAVKDRAIDIFEILAKAEGKVHGVDPDDVAFHEVGALDSIADITLAAYLIEAVGGAEWSTNPIPMGSGRVHTAHGLLPVPAPATLLLMQGLPVFDDGVPGERVTPTGAAILQHLRPKTGGPRGQMTLVQSGMGFGTKRFEGIPNVLRIMSFETAHAYVADRVAVLEFEIDDQTAEDLAIGLEAIRAHPSVLDVSSFAVFGKKNRIAQSIRVLCKPEATQDVQALCFQQTTTLGIRTLTVDRTTLPRHLVQTRTGQVKIADRPGGMTAKVEMDHLADHGGTHQQRAHLSQNLSRDALKQFQNGALE